MTNAKRQSRCRNCQWPTPTNVRLDSGTAASGQSRRFDDIRSRSAMSGKQAQEQTFSQFAFGPREQGIVHAVASAPSLRPPEINGFELPTSSGVPAWRRRLPRKTLALGPLPPPARNGTPAKGRWGGVNVRPWRNFQSQIHHPWCAIDPSGGGSIVQQQPLAWGRRQCSQSGPPSFVLTLAKLIDCTSLWWRS